MDSAGSMLDREALLALYWSSGGPRWRKNQGWAENAEDMGSWHGVTLDDKGRVAKLDLSRNAMEGTIPAALGSLGSLRHLRMSFNSLTGPIPCTFGNLSRLNFIEIRSNQLTGNLPPELGRLTEVSNVDLSCNLLGGHIPPEMGGMTGLLVCWMEKNHIQGPIPAELANIPSLTDLDLAENPVKGLPADGRLQGKDLSDWKEKAKQRLLAQPGEQGRHSRTPDASAGNGGGGGGGTGGHGHGRRGSMEQEYLANIMAKDREIAELRAENDRLRRAQPESGVRKFFSRKENK